MSAASGALCMVLTAGLLGDLTAVKLAYLEWALFVLHCTFYLSLGWWHRQLGAEFTSID